MKQKIVEVISCIRRNRKGKSDKKDPWKKSLGKPWGKIVKNSGRKF